MPDQGTPPKEETPKEKAIKACDAAFEDAIKVATGHYEECLRLSKAGIGSEKQCDKKYDAEFDDAIATHDVNHEAIEEVFGKAASFSSQSELRPVE